MRSIEVNTTTCQVCGKQTDWDSSYGKINYIVCPKCFHVLTKKMGTEMNETLSIIFTLSDTRAEVWSDNANKNIR